MTAVLVGAGDAPSGFTGPQGFERTVTIASGEALATSTERVVAGGRRALAHGRCAEGTLGGCPESQGCTSGGARASEGGQEEAPPEPRGAGADHRGDEKA
jgi:hypothetical protein